MSGKYFYNGIDVNNLITTGTTNPDGDGSYNGFPKCTYTTLNSNFESVSISETVIKSVNEYQDFDSVGTITVTPKFIPCNHISAFCYGGGGGGGGGGGVGDSGAGLIKGGDGGVGGNGGYAAVEKVPVNNGTITLTIGGGGGGGSGGKKAKIPSITGDGGDAGGTGGPGGTTILQVGNITILQATGGNGGNGGRGGFNKAGAFVNQDGDNGNAGSIGTNNLASGGIVNYTIENTKLLPYSNNSGNGGSGRGGGNVNSGGNANDASPGDSGNSGGCRIYFLSSVTAPSFGKYDAAIKQVAGGFISNYTYTSQSETLSIGNAFGGNINRIQAKYIDYDYSVTPITVIPPFTPCNHISAVCYGGGGGGGGGGGYATLDGFGSKNRGGNGQNGKAGGFVASEKIAVNGTITLNIGAAGNLGAGGASTDTIYKDGKSGDPGGPGGTTTLQIGATILLTANGGGAGDNGGGGSQTAKGSNGDPDWKSPGNGTTNATEAFKNYTAEDTANIPSHPTWGNPGNGGGGSTGSGKNGSPGNVGQSGGCRIYFLCI